MSINLVKGQKINLTKDNGQPLSSVMMGLGWDANGGFLGIGGGNIDLDASVGMFDSNKNMVDSVSFRKLLSSDGSIRHSGDNRTGAGDGDDEKIHVNLTTIPINVQSLVFVVNSYEGQKFSKVKNCFCRIVDTVENKEICIFKLNDVGQDNTGLVMAKVYKHNGEWKISALGIPCEGRTISDLTSAMTNCL